MDIEMTEVQSSNIRAIGWQADADEESDVEGAVLTTGTLRITFTSGKTYDYSEVEESVFEEMRSAPSVGQFFHANIRNSYDSEVVS